MFFLYSHLALGNIDKGPEETHIDCLEYLHTVRNKRIIAILEDQLRLSAQREKSLLEHVHQQSIRIEELTATIRSLEEALLLKNGKNPV